MLNKSESYEELLKKLGEKLNKEFDEFKEEIKSNGIDYAIENAEKIFTRQQIIDNLPYSSDLNKRKLKALLSTPDLLNEMYIDWRNSDGNLVGDLECTIENSVKRIERHYNEELKIKSANVR